MNRTITDLPKNEAPDHPTPAFIRMPSEGRRCMYTNLSRLILHNLCVPRPGHTAPVKSSIIKRDGAKLGTIVIDGNH